MLVAAVISFLLAMVQNANLHTDDRALRSGKSTKQNAHKRVHFLDIQSLMNTFGFNGKKNLYEGEFEHMILEMLDRSSTA